MFTSVSKCVVQFFNMITLLFAAGEKVSNTTLILCTVAEDTALIYSDEARITRLKKQVVLEKELSDIKALNVVQ